MTADAPRGPDFEAVFEQSLSALAVLDSNLRYVAVNATYCTLVGRHADELLGSVIFVVFPEQHTPSDASQGSLRTSILDALRTGESQMMPLQRYDVEHPDSGEIVERYWSVTNTPLTGASGGWEFVLNNPEEVTAYVTEAAATAASDGVETSFSTMLARLTHVNEVAAALAAAESVDDIAGAVMTEGTVLAGAVAGSFAHVDGGRVRLSHHLGIDEGVEVRWSNYELAAGGDPFSDAILNGEVVWARDRRELIDRYGHLEDDLRDEHAAWVVVPFVLDDEVLGAVGFIFGAPTDFDLSLRTALSTIANIAAQALARVLLLVEQSRTLESMSQALLRPIVDPNPGVFVDAAYRAAAQRVRAGGDWYDAITLSDDAMLFVIGDVADHGTRAVGEMVRARATVQAFAVMNDRPDQITTKSSEALARLGATHSTCCIAVYRPSTRELQWTTAGHPYPLVVCADGTAEYLAETHGPPLGLVARYGLGRRSLAVGDIVVLYTDGLIERRGESIDAGLDRLRRVVLDVIVDVAPGVNVAESIIDRLHPTGHHDDDIALLIVTVR